MLSPEAGKRWKNAAEASEFLNNIHPLKLRLRSALVPLAAAVLMLAVVVKQRWPYAENITGTFKSTDSDYAGILWICISVRESCTSGKGIRAG